MRTQAAVLLLALGAPVAADAQGSVGSSPSPVVYGSDDRLDWYAETDADLRELGRSSVVALVATVQIDASDPASPFPPFSSDAFTLAEYLERNTGKAVCDGERFVDQPSIAGCSGTLVGPNQVLTAGHCVDDQNGCDAISVVFDYLYEQPGMPARIDPDDVYRCRRILAREKSSVPHVDYAVIELDREVVGHTPAVVRRERTALSAGEDVVVIGFGTGLPMKIDAGGEITDPRASTLDTFAMNTDTFQGNSGAGIFDEDGVLIGLLVTGQEDYVVDQDLDCVRANVLPDTPGGESATYAFHAVDGVCASHPTNSFCGQKRRSRCETTRAGEPLSSSSAELVVGLVSLGLVARRARRRTP